jgi:hypothetical protein
MSGQLPTPRRLLSRRSPKLERAQRLSGIEADGAANSQIIHDVEAAFAAFELGNPRLIGSERVRQVPLGQACSFLVRLRASRWMSRYSQSNLLRLANALLGSARGVIGCEYWEEYLLATHKRRRR